MYDIQYEPVIKRKTASLARSKGFNFVCDYMWERKLTKTPNQNSEFEKWGQDNWYSAPTQALLQKWLRERDVYVYVVPHFEFGDVMGYDFYVQGFNVGFKDTYEDAMEQALLDGLKLI